MPSNPPRRRRPRLTLRVIMLAIVAMAAWLGWRVERANMQRDAVAAIKGLGGAVAFDYQIDACGAYVENAESRAPRWLQDALGPDYFRTVHWFVVTDRTDGADLGFMNGLTDLRGFSFKSGGVDVDDGDLACIRSMPYLTRLYLMGMNVGDATLENAADLSSLESVTLTNTRVTDVGLAHLRGKATLKSLHLENLRVTDASIATLATLNGLEHLGLSGTRFTEAVLTSLEDKTKLVGLDLGGLPITDAGLVRLHELTSLRSLRLVGTNVTPAGVAELRKALPNAMISGP